MSALTFPPRRWSVLHTVYVQLLMAANCTYVAVIDLHIATVTLLLQWQVKNIVYKIAYIHFFFLKK